MHELFNVNPFIKNPICGRKKKKEIDTAAFNEKKITLLADVKYR